MKLNLLPTAACLFGALTSSTMADDVRAGAALVKITPPEGTPMAGYYYARAADGVHDDLYARILVLQQGPVKAALVALDLITTTRPLVESARAEVERLSGIPGTHVMISASHAHTGPVLTEPRSNRLQAQGGQHPLSREYARQLPSLIAQGVAQAESNLQPVQVSAAIGHEPSLAFNRRFHMKDGSVGWNPGKLNTNIIKEAGPVDPAVPVVHFETARQESLATYVNYTVHLDNVGGTLISADLPYTLSRCLSEVRGTNMVTLYTTGTCGDVNHINVRWAEPQRGHANAARMGIILAAEVLRTWPKLTPARPGPLQVRSRLVDLPLPAVSPAQIQNARDSVQRLGARQRSRAEFMEVVDAYKVLDVADRKGEPFHVEVQVVTLGRDLAWVALPGEIFVELGLSLKMDSPFPQTMIAELANGSIGYVPSRRAYPQGNYEVVSARCTEGSGELLVQTAVQLLQEIMAAAPGEG